MSIEAEPIIRNNNEAVLWVQTVVASLQGQAGALTDDVARRACLIGDAVVEEFRARTPTSPERAQVVVPTMAMPHMRGGR